MASLYSIGLSGLQSSTARITTTGQNTANVDTEGYSRQTTSTVSQSGGGVLIQDTDRIVNQYINQQVWSDTSNYNFYESYHSMMTSFDSVIGEESVSIGNYLNTSFSSLQNVNSDPTDSAARAHAYSTFQELVGQYNEMADYVSSQKELASDQIANNVETINNITGQIASLNEQIFKLESTTKNSANELRDQQEQLVKELSEYLDVKVKYDDNQLMTVNLSSGQPLVLQDNSNELALTTNAKDPDGELGIELSFGRYEVNIPTDELGGSMGGLIAFRNEFVTTAERMLGQQALVLADTMNEQNKLGLDANLDYGINLFATDTIKTVPNPNNGNEAASIGVSVTPGASDEILTDTYELVMTSATEFQIVTYDLDGRITSESDTIDISASVAGDTFTVEDYGIDIEVGALANYTAGDRFQFVPTKDAASSLRLSARSGDDFAMASPILVSGDSSNLSDASISISSVTSLDPSNSSFTQNGGLKANAPTRLEFNAAGEVTVYYDAQTTPATAVGPVALTDYTNIFEELGIAEYAGYDISLDSAPQPGDAFSIAFNESGESDNHNGLILADLQNQATVGGTRSYSAAFSSLVTEVGSLTASLETNASASEVVMNQTVAARDQISAVSLDEEAVNLLRYQQSYTASAQVLTAAQNTFSTLISALS
ncbi:flagellar hook-associated protein FlgK [Marinomonas communis]|uniref:flagellar hook-associated protein FlgK n=1 Tax=Marinomonas communis TaxID=28254 RepID=UPI001D1836E4|nr:flagellar hook-associated protein FlgK [Marinomonas communis]MCC4274493.1 flagellar hook-associated protein FlgK [Marinomonas communis]